MKQPYMPIPFHIPLTQSIFAGDKDVVNMTMTQIIGLVIAVVAGSIFTIIQVRMWRSIAARRKLQQMIDDVSQTKEKHDDKTR